MTIKKITAMMLVLCAIMGTVIADFGVPKNETRTWNGKTATAKVRICTFNSSGIRTSGKFTILITTPYDKNYRRTWSGTSTNDLVLSGAYDTYYIQIKRNGTGRKNVANCYWWSYDAKSNCHFW